MYVCMYYVICFGVQYVCLYELCNMSWCAKCMFVCTMRYALVCKMYVCMYYEICYGVQNVCTMKYALVCKMYVCMYHEICFGVQNVCLYVP